MRITQKRKGGTMKNIFIALTLISGGIQASAANEKAPNSEYANFTKMELDPMLPEPFARTQAAQVIVNNKEQDVSLAFLMSESEGIEVTFPITSDVTDECHNRTVVAAPPFNSTPYYKDFEIKVIDYRKNTCATTPEAVTVVTLKSYEVNTNSKTLSKLYAGALQPNKEHKEH